MDTFAHITIPLLILLALRVHTRKVLLMLPFTVVMDLDFFFPGAHRLLFHNLIIVLVLPIFIIIYLDKYFPRYRQYGLIAFFYLVSHFILDLGVGMAIFYPLTTDYYFFEAEMFFQFWGPLPIPDLSLDYGIMVAEETQIVSEGMSAGDTATQYSSVSNISSGLFLTLVVAALMYYEKSFTFLKEIWKLLVDIKDFFLEKLRSIFKL
ncbi:MAG: hypothetical protein ACOC55_04335 [Candidatus Natronoplasma sp.]